MMLSEGRSHGFNEQKGPVLVMPPPRGKPSRWQLWRARIFLVEYTLVCLVIGIILIVAPWTALWTTNSLLLGYPQVRDFLMTDFARGLVSGIGIVDIWLAIAEVLRYREHPA